MKIIPVLDLLNGIAVHAMHGDRNKYRPLNSILWSSPDPLELSKVFASQGFHELYVADLDSILGNKEDFSVLSRICSETELSLMVDAGINDLGKAERVLEAGASTIIIGTETLTGLGFVGEAIKALGEDRVIVSIDLKGGELLSKSEKIRSMTPPRLVKALEELGVTNIIVLDLARVGSEQGINMGVIVDILEETRIGVMTGGGIRGIEDLEKVSSLGVSGVLIATILHTGKLTVADLVSKGFL
ncbi:MAG: HisA/HisF-related TIM barrel protein [Candidatus Bathyarchaeota archaeon]|jgi:phosphoribosylformimino-5-aminoimidazole carboxamide ribotide isomerase|nr:HisA/HisF-related TIM barrel protein [Candidatus Bathyarchaeota archaeon]